VINLETSRLTSDPTNLLKMETEAEGGETGEMMMNGLVWFCDVTTVGLCVICKIPQIMTIMKSRSVEGLSATSLLLELLTYAISLSYNWMKGYPLGSYMEDPFLCIQTLIVLLIVYYYQSQLDVTKYGMIGGGAALFYALALGFPHPAVLPVLLTATLPMKVFSKFLQIKEIWIRKSAGSISLVSWGINVYTCLTRIITTAMVTGDMTLLLKHSISVTLNSVVIAEALYYGSGKSKVDEDDRQTLLDDEDESRGSSKKSKKNKKNKHKRD